MMFAGDGIITANCSAAGPIPIQKATASQSDEMKRGDVGEQQAIKRLG